MTNTDPTAKPHISIGIIARNQENAIGPALKSLFQQSLLKELSRSNLTCEILCLANGCTDRTPEIAEEEFAEETSRHPFRQAFQCQTLDINERSKLSAWNLFVHKLSARESQFLFLMDGDILIRHPQTLWNMYSTLVENPKASIATDQPIKNISLKELKSWRERIALATSEMADTIQGKITGQLYCIRADVARQLYLPQDLAGLDDSFIESVVDTDFSTGRPAPSRIVTAENASHLFEAYTSVAEVLNNQERHAIGKTIAYVLIEHLKHLPREQRSDLARTLREKEQSDPRWLRRLIDEHLRNARFFWQLFPDVLRCRAKRGYRILTFKKATHFPAAFVRLLVTWIACARAFRHLKGGQMHDWTEASRDKIPSLELVGRGEQLSQTAAPAGEQLKGFSNIKACEAK